MTTAAAALVSAVFAALAALHLYWAAGGTWGASDAVPHVRGAPALEPGTGSTLVVAVLLAAAATLVGLRGGLVHWAAVPPWLPEAGTWVVGATMAARAVGDFRLFGLFKRVRGSRFARLDDAIYTPLCLVLAAGCLAVLLGRGR